MSDSYPPEVPRSSNFRITNYPEFYEPSGRMIEFPFSDAALEDWRRFTGEREREWFGVGQKLILPEGAEPGYRITWGRQRELVDVVVDMDIVGDTTQRELGVSREHVAVSKGPDGRWEIEDLGSTNGTQCYRRGTGAETKDLKLVTEPWVLEDGDTILMGGGPGVAGRLIGFRFFDPGDEAAYFTKFYATSMDELASGSGLYVRRPDLVGKIPVRHIPEQVTVEVERAGQELVGIQESILKLKEGEDKTAFLQEALKFHRRMIELLEGLGDSFYQGDWVLAAAEVGQWAFLEGEKLVRDNEEVRDQSVTEKGRAYLLVATKAMEFATSYVFEG